MRRSIVLPENFKHISIKSGYRRNVLWGGLQSDLQQNVRRVEIIMKIKCIRLLDSDGREVEFSSWLTLGRIYHVMSIFTDKNGRRSYGIVNRQPAGEWPQMGSHQAECFEVVSDVVPSNWKDWVHENSSGTSPVAWQEPSFYEAFYDHEPAAYSIFDRERAVILSEDP